MVLIRVEARRVPSSWPAKVRREWQKSIREQARFSNLRTLVGDIPRLATLRKVLKSLGAFKRGILVRSLTDFYTLPGYTEFTLSGNGLRFFKELLRSKDINRQAYLLVYREEKDGGIGRPGGILFEDRASGRVHFFDLSVILDAPRVAEAEKPIACLTEKVFPGQGSARPIGLKIETVNVQDRWWEKQKFDCKLALLNLDNGVYSHGSRDNEAFAELDYQEVLHRNAGEITGKSVVETGVGFGVNVIYALRFGARSVWGNEPFHVYRQLAHWNIQFAQDTGQICPVAPGAVEISNSRGLDKAPGAEVYLFNTPSIRTQTEIDRLDQSPLISQSYYISETEFMGIFGELKSRLADSSALALWRVLPMFSPNDRPENFALTQGMRLGMHTAQSMAYHPSRALFGGLPGCVPECARNFLEEQGVKAEPKGHGDIFLIRGG